MKLNTVTRDVAQSGTLEVSRAKIKASKKIFDMFADQTYANKPVAILRELVANGVDAHTAAGKPDVPVEIHMPSEFDPVFKVKDFGIGMPHEFVMGPFMEYTNGSTKDQANDQIGGFGIGSKSPFAYCDQFTLRVTHDGVLSVYTMFKDEEGIPAIGLQGQTTTDESNGVEVSFPVEMDDMEDFRSAAQEALQYFQPLPKVFNGTLEAPNYTHTSKSGAWAMKASPDGTLGIIMGGVRYPVTSDNLTYTLRNDSKLSPLLNYGIDLTLPIGACDVAMSREALSYTDRTNKAIEAALRGIVDEVADTFAHLFDKAKTYWEAQVLLHKQLTQIAGNVHGYGARNNARANMLKSFARWKGQPLELNTKTSISNTWDSATRAYKEVVPKGYPLGAELWLPQFYMWRKTFPSAKFTALKDYSQITPGDFAAVFIDDMDISPKSRVAARVNEYMVSKGIQEKSVAIFRAAKNKDAASIKKMLKFLGDPLDVVYLSKLPEPARAQRVITKTDGTTVARPKMRMFKFDGNRDKYGNRIVNLAPAHAKKGNITEIGEADQPDKGVYAAMSYWSLPKGIYDKMATGLMKWDEVIFINDADAKKLDKKRWKKFEDVFDKRLKAYKNKITNLEGMVWTAEQNGALSDVLGKIATLKQGDLTLPTDKKNTTFGKLVAFHDKYVVPYSDEAKALVKVLDVKGTQPDDYDPKLPLQWEKDHPWAARVYDGIHWNMNRKRNVELFVHNL